jgi:hypothetical protein
MLLRAAVGAVDAFGALSLPRLLPTFAGTSFETAEHIKSRLQLVALLSNLSRIARSI